MTTKLDDLWEALDNAIANLRAEQSYTAALVLANAAEALAEALAE